MTCETRQVSAFRCHTGHEEVVVYLGLSYKYTPTFLKPLPHGLLWLSHFAIHPDFSRGGGVPP